MMARGEKKGEEVVEVLLPRLLPLPAFFLSPFPKWLLDYCGSNSKGEREKRAPSPTTTSSSSSSSGLEVERNLPASAPLALAEDPPAAREAIGLGRTGGRTAEELEEGNACVHEIEGTLSIPDKTFGSTSFLCGRRGECTHFTPCCCPTFISR